MLAFAPLVLADGLTLMEILTDIPHDAGALVVYVLLGLFVFLIGRGSSRNVLDRYRGSPRAPDGSPDGGHG